MAELPFSELIRWCLICECVFETPSRARFCDDCQTVLNRIPIDSETLSPQILSNSAFMKTRNARIALYRQRADIEAPIFAGDPSPEPAPRSPSESTYDEERGRSMVPMHHVQLWTMIQTCPELWDSGRDRWRGLSKELYGHLVACFSEDVVGQSVRSAKSLGLSLGGLRKRLPDKIEYVQNPHCLTRFTIFRDKAFQAAGHVLR